MVGAVAAGVLLQVSLVVVFGRPESGAGLVHQDDLGGYRTVALLRQLLAVRVEDAFDRRGVITGGEEKYGAVLGPDVGALAIALGGVVVF